MAPGAKHLSVRAAADADASSERAQLSELPAATSTLRQCLPTPSPKVAVTLSNGRYADLIAPWSVRLRGLGWADQVHIGLDGVAQERATAVLGACAVPIGVCTPAVRPRVARSSSLTVPHGTLAQQSASLAAPTRNASSRLPPGGVVGTAKLAMVALLLGMGHGVVVLSEIDVIWLADPWPALASALSVGGDAAAADVDHGRIGVAAAEDYPWSDRTMNFGFIAVRQSAAACRFFEEVRGDPRLSSPIPSPLHSPTSPSPLHR